MYQMIQDFIKGSKNWFVISKNLKEGKTKFTWSWPEDCGYEERCYYYIVLLTFYPSYFLLHLYKLLLLKVAYINKCVKSVIYLIFYKKIYSCHMSIPVKIIHKNAFYHDVQKSEITFMGTEAEYNHIHWPLFEKHCYYETLKHTRKFAQHDLLINPNPLGLQIFHFIKNILA